MSPRDTRTGGVLEAMILPALHQGGYKYETQAVVGTRLGGRKHRIDVLATDKKGANILVSLKWQQTSGTAEQKIPFEVICLGMAIEASKGKFKRAYLVLGGTGWTLRDYYVGGGLKEYISNGQLTRLVTLEQFVTIANNGKL